MRRSRGNSREHSAAATGTGCAHCGHLNDDNLRLRSTIAELADQLIGRPDVQAKIESAVMGARRKRSAPAQRYVIRVEGLQ
jgi:hypothetical protein